VPLPAIRDTVEAKYKDDEEGTPTPRPPEHADDHEQVKTQPTGDRSEVRSR
jgi:hypothetical protein